RMTLGRERVAKAGKWTNGPVPIGYDLDAAGCLTPSARHVAAAGQTEAEVIRALFERVAAGGTTIAEARRFNTLGGPVERRYGGGVVTGVSKTGLRPPRRIPF